MSWVPGDVPGDPWAPLLPVVVPVAAVIKSSVWVSVFFVVTSPVECTET